MSQENVEIVRNAFDAFTRGDTDGVLQLCHEDISITQPRSCRASRGNSADTAACWKPSASGRSSGTTTT
jgi:ketosteroid isomerase-like protein